MTPLTDPRTERGEGTEPVRLLMQNADYWRLYCFLKLFYKPFQLDMLLMFQTHVKAKIRPRGLIIIA